jgi:BMFP domain-containing protein YqiC
MREDKIEARIQLTIRRMEFYVEDWITAHADEIGKMLRPALDRALTEVDMYQRVKRELDSQIGVLVGDAIRAKLRDPLEQRLEAAIEDVLSEVRR